MAEEQRRNLEQEISDNARQLRSEWDHAMAWLVDYGFVEPSREGGDGCGTLTARILTLTLTLTLILTLTLTSPSP